MTTLQLVGVLFGESLDNHVLLVARLQQSSCIPYSDKYYRPRLARSPQQSDWNSPEAAPERSSEFPVYRNHTADRLLDRKHPATDQADRFATMILQSGSSGPGTRQPASCSTDREPRQRGWCMPRRIHRRNPASSPSGPGPPGLPPAAVGWVQRRLLHPRHSRENASESFSVS